MYNGQPCQCLHPTCIHYLYFSLKLEDTGNITLHASTQCYVDSLEGARNSQPEQRNKQKTSPTTNVESDNMRCVSHSHIAVKYNALFTCWHVRTSQGKPPFYIYRGISGLNANHCYIIFMFLNFLAIFLKIQRIPPLKDTKGLAKNAYFWLF